MNPWGRLSSLPKSDNRPRLARQTRMSTPREYPGLNLNRDPRLGVSLSFWLDGLSLTFALLIGGIGFLVVLYSTKYMAGKAHLARFLLVHKCGKALLVIIGIPKQYIQQHEAFHIEADG